MSLLRSNPWSQALSKASPPKAATESSVWPWECHIVVVACAEICGAGTGAGLLDACLLYVIDNDSGLSPGSDAGLGDS
jgi:hypothetical protein